MGFLDGLGKKVTDAGQRTIQKTKEISDIARINSLIAQEENKLNNTYCQIGKLYVTVHGKDGEEEFANMVEIILELEQKIRDYKRQIQDIKGVQRCEKCGAEILRGVAFCSSCGTPMPKIQIQDHSEECTKCLNCGSIVKKKMNFCTSCGTPVTQTVISNISYPNSDESEISDEVQGRVCSVCGNKQDEDSVFCTECGTKL